MRNVSKQRKWWITCLRVRGQAAVWAEVVDRCRRLPFVARRGWTDRLWSRSRTCGWRCGLRRGRRLAARRCRSTAGPSTRQCADAVDAAGTPAHDHSRPISRSWSIHRNVSIQLIDCVKTSTVIILPPINMTVAMQIKLATPVKLPSRRRQCRLSLIISSGKSNPLSKSLSSARTVGSCSSYIAKLLFL